ncbi:MAG: 23S rRNA (pseudouridine(1915)-N(3))-methyltransferase RlmH [Minisyncoccia bacterium]
MKIMIITVGSPQLSFAQQGIAEYMKRISRFADVDLVHVKEDKKTNEKILKLCDKKFVVLLDEKGKKFSSQTLSIFLEKQKNQSQNICFVVGGPNGHTSEIRNRGDYIWSMSDLTFPHDIAMMVLVETLYRSLSISAGHPYHRD